VVATFTMGGRVALVATTAPGHRAGRIRPGSRSSGARGVRRAGPRSRLIVGVERGRVTFVGVAARATLTPRTLAVHPRRAGLR
jgi:hypothetical protein